MMPRLQPAPMPPIPPSLRRSRQNAAVQRAAAARSNEASRTQAGLAPAFFFRVTIHAMPDERPKDASTPNADPVPFGKREEERSLPWVPMAIGAALLGLAIVAVIFFSRGGDE